MKIAKPLLVWLLAGLLTLNSVYITLVSNGNLGTWMLWAFSLLLIVYGLFHKKIDACTKQGAGRVLKILFLSGLTVFLGLLAFVAVSGYTNEAKGDEDAIIVLGAGVHGERVSDVLRRRLDAALAAWRQNPGALLVVTGGQGPGEAIPEAEAMRRWLKAQGVPPESILTEDKSTSTEENLRFALALLEERGFSPSAPVAVVTNAFHCYRAGGYARLAGFQAVRCLPASMHPGAVLPSYMREVAALLAYWFLA